MKFGIHEFTDAKLTSINPRSEKHGPEALNPAVDLTYTMDVHNSLLSMFDPELLKAIYHRSEAATGDGKQGNLDGIDEISELPNLRFPAMGVISWGKELSGFTHTISHGIGGKSDIHLMDCKIKGFRIEPKEGGTVSIKFQVQCSTNLNEKTMGKISLLAQQTIPIKLIPPEPSGQNELVENPFPVDGKEKKQQTPEEAFVQTGSTVPPL